MGKAGWNRGTLAIVPACVKRSAARDFFIVNQEFITERIER